MRIFAPHTAGPAIREISHAKRQFVCRSGMQGNCCHGQAYRLRLWKCQGRQQHFFSAVFAARAPAMGNSADRDWQLSQLVEGVLTAFNPSHGSLFRRGRRARRARFPTCGVVRVAGYSVVWECISTSVFLLKSTKRSAATILGRSAPSLLFHGALRNILLPTGFPATIHMIELEQTFANDSLQKISAKSH